MSSLSQKKNLPFVLIAIGVVAIGVFLVIRSATSGDSKASVVTAAGVTSNTSVTDGKQLIEINVKGGYSPRETVAKAGVPTTLRFVTKGSFDCSTAVTIPAIGYEGNLPMTGNTDVEIPAQDANTTLEGYCAMGMYFFDIRFQ